MNFEVIQHLQTPNTPGIDNISEFIATNKDSIEAFKNYAISQKGAIGLAANQCSIDGERFNLRMAAIKNVDTHKCIVAIDPRIVKYYGIKRQRAEGCLTWGFNGKGYWCVIADRYHTVDVEYYTPDGEFHKETHKGYQAQVWQHEINHINGIEEVIINKAFDRCEVYEPIDLDVKRNDPCPCGSGLKYKKCCIENF